MRVPHLLGILLGLGMVFSAAASASAEPVTVVWQVNLDVPVIDRAVLGTVTTNGDSDTGEGTWTFQGTIDGNLANASGTGIYTCSDSSATATITSIDTWNMPGAPKPRKLPVSATIRFASDLAYVTYHGGTISFTGLPVAISEPLPCPLESGTYSVAMAGSGSEDVDELPETGTGATAAGNVGILGKRPTILVGLGAVALAGLGGVGVVAFNHRRVRRRGTIT